MFGIRRKRKITGLVLYDSCTPCIVIEKEVWGVYYIYFVISKFSVRFGGVYFCTKKETFDFCRKIKDKFPIYIEVGTDVYCKLFV